MSKFKVGDRVRILKDRPSFARLRKGNVVTVMGTEDGSGDDIFHKVTEGWCVRVSDMELVVDEPVTAPSTVSYEPPPGLLDYMKSILTGHPDDWGREEQAVAYFAQKVAAFYGLTVRTLPATVEFVREAA